MKIFIDTEFTDFIDCHLISIGAVTEDGREFYAEVTDYPKEAASNFVKANIIPLLGQPADPYFKGTFNEVSARFGSWIDELKTPMEICIDYSTDWDFAVALLEDLWPSNLDTQCVNIYADMQLKCVQKNAVRSLDDVMLDMPPLHTVIKESKDLFNNTFLGHFEDRKNVPGYIQHHALFDARANREGWLAAVKYIKSL